MVGYRSSGFRTVTSAAPREPDPTELPATDRSLAASLLLPRGLRESPPPADVAELPVDPPRLLPLPPRALPPAGTGALEGRNAWPEPPAAAAATDTVTRAGDTSSSEATGDSGLRWL